MTLIIAQSIPSSSTSLEFDWPATTSDFGLATVLLLAVLYAVMMIVRDTRRLPRWVTAVLALLRVSVLAALAVIALNPHLRTQSEIFRPSRVLLLVDTSKSMQQPETDPRESLGQIPRTRAQAIGQLLSESPLIERILQTHQLDVYTFDDDLSELKLHLAGATSDGETFAEPAPKPSVAEWSQILEPQGLSTRLGDALDALLVEERSPTLSGVVVISDGASNAGRDIRAARGRAQAAGVRLVTIGVGSERPPVNVAVARVVSPTEVQKGDAFDLTAFIQGLGLAGRMVRVELLQKLKGTEQSELVDSKEVELPDGGAPAEVVFSRNPIDAGEYEYTVRAVVPDVLESRTEDNEQTRSITVFDRPLRILVVAGGPMREYSFARTILHRHSAMEIDVWLQSGKVGISQEANSLLFRFPESKEELYPYDVLIAFDPAWELVDEAQHQLLENWVASEGGGVIFVAGDIFTRRLVSDSGSLQTIRRLLPVELDETGLSLGAADQAAVPFPVGLTQEGETAAFLSLDENLSAAESWQEFRGVYRCYPTRGRKAGTTVYAEFTDPLSRGPDGQPPLIAGHRFGQGQVLYLGSPEMWRLRALNPDFYERFWIKLVRKGAEGRSKRGAQRGLFILEGRDFDIGQTVPIRARVVSAQFEPLEADELALDVTDPNGRPLLPPPVLRRDRNRPAEYVGELRGMVPGRYVLRLEIPDSTEAVTADVNVQLPQLEAASLTQNAVLLRTLVDGTGGRYVTLEEAPDIVPTLLPNRGRSEVIDERIEEVWDRQWVMFLLAGLLSVEWLIRKLLKLA